jgi:hypothetical protein
MPVNLANRRGGTRRGLGQSMVEFALCVPFLLLIVIGICYFGRAFYIKQIMLYAAQEGARFAARTPNLDDPAVRDNVRGFTTSGSFTNYYSVIPGVLGSANLLSFGDCGDLPPGAAVKILPWDADGSFADYTPPGTISVRVVWPFSFMYDPFNGPAVANGPTAVAIPVDVWGVPIQFPDFTMSEIATVTPEIYEPGEYQQ